MTSLIISDLQRLSFEQLREKVKADPIFHQSLVDTLNQQSDDWVIKNYTLASKAVRLLSDETSQIQSFLTAMKTAQIFAKNPIAADQKLRKETGRLYALYHVKDVYYRKGSSEEGEKLFQEANAQGNDYLVNELLDMGIEVKNLDSLLNDCLSKGMNTTLSTLLNRFPVEDKKKGSLLLEAVKKHNLLAAKILLEQGADIETRTREGGTPLLLAYGDKEMTEFLIDKGADIQAKFSSGHGLFSSGFLSNEYPSFSYTISEALKLKFNHDHLTALECPFVRGDVKFASELAAHFTKEVLEKSISILKIKYPHFPKFDAFIEQMLEGMKQFPGAGQKLLGDKLKKGAYAEVKDLLGIGINADPEEIKKQLGECLLEESIKATTLIQDYEQEKSITHGTSDYLRERSEKLIKNSMLNIRLLLELGAPPEQLSLYNKNFFLELFSNFPSTHKLVQSQGLLFFDNVFAYWRNHPKILASEEYNSRDSTALEIAYLLDDSELAAQIAGFWSREQLESAKKILKSKYPASDAMIEKIEKNIRFIQATVKIQQFWLNYRINKEKKQIKALRSRYEDDPLRELERLKRKPFVHPTLKAYAPEPLSIIFGRAMEIKRLYSETHYVFTHGQSLEISMINQLIKELIKTFYPHQYQPLTSPFRLPGTLQDFQNAEKFLKLHENINDHELRDSLLSVDGDNSRYVTDESALYFTDINASVGSGYIYQFFENIVVNVLSEMHLFDEKTCAVFAKRIAILAKEKAPKSLTGTLYTICIPKKSVQEPSESIVYDSKPFGKPVKQTNSEMIERLENRQLREEYVDDKDGQYRILTAGLSELRGVRSFAINNLSKDTNRHYKNELRSIISDLKKLL